jgi:hypothetical protein
MKGGIEVGRKLRLNYFPSSPNAKGMMKLGRIFWRSLKQKLDFLQNNTKFYE